MTVAKLYVPDNADAKRGKSNPHEYVRIAFGNYWGGWTEYDARGGWVGPDGPVRESVTVFEAATNDDDADRELLKATAEKVLERTTESAVLAVYGGEKIMVEK